MSIIIIRPYTVLECLFLSYLVLLIYLIHINCHIAFQINDFSSRDGHLSICRLTIFILHLEVIDKHTYQILQLYSFALAVFDFIDVPVAVIAHGIGKREDRVLVLGLIGHWRNFMSLGCFGHERWL